MDVEEITGQDMGTLLERYKKVQEDLTLLNFSEYETRAYVALVALGVSEAETIAMTAQIPRTSMYKVLDSLLKKGYVTVTKGRPRKYLAEPPMALKERIFSRLEETFDDLEFLHGILRERGLPQVIQCSDTEGVAGEEDHVRKKEGRRNFHHHIARPEGDTRGQDGAQAGADSHRRGNGRQAGPHRQRGPGSVWLHG